MAKLSCAQFRDGVQALRRETLGDEDVLILMEHAEECVEPVCQSLWQEVAVPAIEQLRKSAEKAAEAVLLTDEWLYDEGHPCGYRICHECRVGAEVCRKLTEIEDKPANGRD